MVAAATNAGIVRSWEQAAALTEQPHQGAVSLLSE